MRGPSLEPPVALQQFPSSMPSLLFYLRRRYQLAPSAPSAPSASVGQPGGFDPLMDQAPRPMSDQGTVAPSLPETRTSMLRHYICVSWPWLRLCMLMCCFSLIAVWCFVADMPRFTVPSHNPFDPAIDHGRCSCGRTSSPFSSYYFHLIYGIIAQNPDDPATYPTYKGTSPPLTSKSYSIALLVVQKKFYIVVTTPNSQGQGLGYTFPLSEL
jgi:hypothetical protein